MGVVFPRTKVGEGKTGCICRPRKRNTKDKHARFYHNSCINTYKMEHSALPYRFISNFPATHAREGNSTVENMIGMGKNMPEYLPSESRVACLSYYIILYRIDVVCRKAYRVNVDVTEHKNVVWERKSQA